MKVSYEKPVTFVGLMQYQIDLLGASPVTGQFTDEEPANWDVDGANSNEYHFDNNFWDEE